jgi:hypothetical protein
MPAPRKTGFSSDSAEIAEQLVRREMIIDGFSKIQPASDVPSGRLHGRVSEQKLDLFEFAAGLMTGAGASATKITGSTLFTFTRVRLSDDRSAYRFPCVRRP